MTFDRYKTDLARLLEGGDKLLNAIIIERHPEQAKKQKIPAEYLSSLPKVKVAYQSWYSESLACISAILPARADDFISYYKPDKPRKEITYSNYTLSDYLKGLTRKNWDDSVIVGPDAAIPPMEQQLAILKACQQRFDTSLFDIRALAQADLFDNELDIADELLKRKFNRAAGAVAGVVLESHLDTLCSQHQITVKKSSGISALNDALKKSDVFDTPTWRFIQRMGDIRNQCDHKGDEPSTENIRDLVDGVRKTIKTLA